MSPRGRGLALLGGAVALATAMTAYGATARPAPPTPATPTTVPVAASVRVCPTTPPVTAPVSVTHLAAATLPRPLLPAPVSAGTAVLTPLSGSRKPLVALDAPGAQGSVASTAHAGVSVPSVLRAQGSLAPGAAVSQVRYVRTGPQRSLTGELCPAPTGNAWFVGGSGATGRLTTLELDNPDATPAVADVLVYGEHGEVPAPAGRGVTVAPHGHTTLRVDILAPGLARVALHVMVRAGRLAMTVTDAQTAGLLPRGADVVPQTAGPARRLVIAGVPSGLRGSRSLEILAPGDQDALVRVQVITRQGRFTPDELAALDVPAHTLTQAQLISQVGNGSAGLLITSDVPVVAAVRNVLGAKGAAPDVTYSVASRALSGPVLSPGMYSGRRWVSRLFLTAASTTGAVRVTLLRPDGTSRATTVSVTGGTSLELVLGGADQFAATVAPVAGTGPVQAAAWLEYDDPLGQVATQWPLVSSPLTDTLPPVSQDPAVGVPDG
ncbi:MAG TPA: DUF5719 family protein [Actinomycetes bacterium]|nr:DUF5719 family protein [Actinomycetes bacterium]